MPMRLETCILRKHMLAMETPVELNNEKLLFYFEQLDQDIKTTERYGDTR